MTSNSKMISTILKYSALAIGEYIVVSPKLALNQMGLCYKKSFELADIVIERPESFKSRDQRKAFEDIGRYVTDFLTRDMMIVYTDSNLTRKGDLFDRDKLSLEAWHETLSYFAENGAIQERWSLSLPMYERGIPTTYRTTPSWGPDGEALANPGTNSFLGGLAPGETTFSPEALTKEQKQSLLGTAYATRSWRKEDPATHTISEADFEKVYYRKRATISEQCKEKSMATFGKIMKSYVKAKSQ